MISGLKKTTEALGYKKARPVSKLEDQVFAVGSFDLGGGESYGNHISGNITDTTLPVGRGLEIGRASCRERV